MTDTNQTKNYGLSIVAKTLLVATSLVPMLGAVALNTRDKDYFWCVASGAAVLAVVLGFACKGILCYAAKTETKVRRHIKEFERKDAETLVYLLTYTLPLASESMAHPDNWPVLIYLLAVIILVVICADALHFNPIMMWMGYRFYAVKNAEGAPYTLISKKKLDRAGETEQAVCLADGIYLHLHKGEENAR